MHFRRFTRNDDALLTSWPIVAIISDFVKKVQSRLATPSIAEWKY